MKKKLSLTVFIPAYNEEGNIENAINNVDSVLKRILTDYEILVVNDGSKDNTSEIVTRLIKRNKKIRLIDRKQNLGLGLTFCEGVANAKKEYITQFHGDNDASPKFIRDLILHVDDADFISIYPKTLDNRSFVRNMISKVFIIFLDTLFQTKLRYYNGGFICKMQILRSLKLISKGFTIYAESQIRMIKTGYSYKQIPFVHIGRKEGKSSALKPKNIFQTCKDLFLLFRDIYI